MLPIESERAPNLAFKIKIPQIGQVTSGFDLAAAIWHGFDGQPVLKLQGAAL